MSLLVTGFGPFPGVADNPTTPIAQALDGAQVLDQRIVGLVLPVSYTRAPALTIETARAMRARCVVGLGVATGRAGVEVERVARRVAHGLPDVDGCCDPGTLGPDRVTATCDVVGLAAALGARVSDDAGGYVCNAWLYQVTQALTVPVGFVHVPSAGMDAELLRRALVSVFASVWRPTTHA